MGKGYFETMEFINEQITFLQSEREIAFNREKEINELKTLSIEIKNEFFAEWEKIITNLDYQLNYFYNLKKRINSIYQNDN